MIKDYAVFIQNFLYPLVDRLMEVLQYAEKQGIKLDKDLILRCLTVQLMCVIFKCLAQVVVVSIVVLGTLKLCTT